MHLDPYIYKKGSKDPHSKKKGDSQPCLEILKYYLTLAMLMNMDWRAGGRDGGDAAVHLHGADHVSGDHGGQFARRRRQIRPRQTKGILARIQFNKLKILSMEKSKEKKKHTAYKVFCAKLYFWDANCKRSVGRTDRLT